MRIIFFGTGKFGLPTLKKLLNSDHELVAAVTQPDRKKGRGWNVQPGSVKAFLEKAAPDVDVYQPERASDKDFIDSLAEIEADVFVVIDYGQILGKKVLDMPRKYCVNLHPSLLPKYRGAAPVNWAIINGEKETGNTVFRMTERMDAGEIIVQDRTKIGDDEDATTLLERLSGSGSDLVLRALEMIEKGEEILTEQDEGKVICAPKLTKEMGQIDWTSSAAEILKKIRGMRPWPAAFTYLDGNVLKVIQAEACGAESDEGEPGSIVDEARFIVNTGKGKICVKKLQLEGKKAMDHDEFLRGYHMKSGTVLG